jgi:hypothetical protein
MNGTIGGFFLGVLVSALALGVGVRTVFVAVGHWIRVLIGF